MKKVNIYLDQVRQTFTVSLSSCRKTSALKFLEQVYWSISVLLKGTSVVVMREEQALETLTVSS